MWGNQWLLGLRISIQVQHLRNFNSEWKTVKLGLLTELIQDGTHNTPHYVADGVPFYSVETVISDDYENVKLISDAEHARLSKRCKLQKNDILMTRIGDVGTVKVIDWEPTASIYVSIALIRTTEQLSPFYLAQYMKSESFMSEIWKYMLHSAVPKKINLGEIKHCMVKYPVDICAQERIASALMNVDKKISCLAKKLANLKLILNCEDR